MTPEQMECIATYLRENLRINVSMTDRLDFYSSGVKVEVEIMLGDEIISKSSDYITTSSSY